MERNLADKICLIPKVKSLRLLGGVLKSPESRGVDTLIGGDAAGPAERYTLSVSADGVKIVSPSRQGAYRAETTLRQLMMNCPDGLPCLEIHDEPGFPVRGFYHDVTRGRVPTLETLKHLADTLAFYKINHLQLYVEHTFAFGALPDLWKDKDPLTADDIRELDKYCAGRFIDLVPSLSTFGHMYELLRLPRFEHLNELDIRASQTTRCLWDRMAHYTLDVGNPESFDLVRGMIEEYAPLFSSPYFNICCDETFDLGTGKNAGRAEREGVGRLYVDFVGKIMGVVRSMGKKPMLWGDIVLKHPELISDLAGDDTVFLNWEYTPEVTDVPVQTFKDAGVKQYVCPGVNGWSRFATDVNRACTNISKMIRYGKEAGALGVLNTDWGDCGQVNLLSNSYHGLAFGADLSWSAGGVNVGNGIDVGGIDAVDGIDFDGRFSRLQWGTDDDGRLGKILRELGGLSGYHFGNLYAWINGKRCLWFKEDEVKDADPAELARKYHRAAELKNQLGEYAAQSADTANSVFTTNSAEFKEYIWAADATAWLLALLIVKKKYEYRQEVNGADIPVNPKQLVDGGHAILEEFKKLWRARNRESELSDVVGTFENVFARIQNYV